MVQFLGFFKVSSFSKSSFNAAPCGHKTLTSLPKTEYDKRPVDLITSETDVIKHFTAVSYKFL
jgi:hypothetical protein